MSDGAAPPVDLPAAAAAPRSNQRERILDAALQLMSDQGVAATSMRQLAKACGLNVAAIYHYFPSKADLLRSVIEERQYLLQLRDLPPLDRTLEPRERFAALIEAIWTGAVGEEPIWRLLLGESLRGDQAALGVGAELLHAIEAALQAWLAELFPDLGDRREAIAATVIGQLYSAFIERLFLPDRDVATVRRRAQALAEAIIPG